MAFVIASDSSLVTPTFEWGQAMLAIPIQMAEGERLELSRDCSRRISNAVAYQFAYPSKGVGIILRWQGSFSQIRL